MILVSLRMLLGPRGLAVACPGAHEPTAANACVARPNTCIDTRRANKLHDPAALQHFPALLFGECLFPFHSPLLVCFRTHKFTPCETTFDPSNVSIHRGITSPPITTPGMHLRCPHESLQLMMDTWSVLFFFRNFSAALFGHHTDMELQGQKSTWYPVPQSQYDIRGMPLQEVNSWQGGYGDPPRYQ